MVLEIVGVARSIDSAVGGTHWPAVRALVGTAISDIST